MALQTAASESLRDRPCGMSPYPGGVGVLSETVCTALALESRSFSLSCSRWVLRAASAQ